MTSPSTLIPAAARRPLPSPVRPKTPTYPKLVWALIVLLRFLRAYACYLRTGRNTDQGQADMRRLYRLTNGRFNDVLAGIQGIAHPARRLPRQGGILGPSHEATSAAAEELRREGFFRFDARVPEDLPQRLRSFAREAPCRVCPTPPGNPGLVTYDVVNPLGTRYLVDAQALHEQPDIQRLAVDMSLLSFAQAYLGCRPVFLGCEMWWSTAFAREPCAEAAQLYHFDMSQIRFLKIFIYLTDVHADNGAHAFVRTSHRRLPRGLRADRRYRDDEILEHFPAERIMTVEGPAGSVFAEDTRGLH